MDDGARQASAHDGVQADAGVSHRVRAVCRFPARLFRLEHAAADHRANHADGRCGDHRLGRAISPGRHPPARVRRRCPIASARLEPLCRDHARGGTGDEVDRLATNLNAMLERIEALMHGLKEVSDNIAHDLKTPLTRLRNRCEEALRLAEDESQYRAALESTIEESEALIRTFNALLMIARAESGQARDGMTEFDAAEIARGVGELYDPLADEKGIHLKVEAPAAAPVHGNRELISQALANLVDNAIKYGATGGPPLNGAAAEILVTAAGEGDRILLAVADSGRGIPAADRGRAVERFVRLEQSRSPPGSGLGLSLASAGGRPPGGGLQPQD